MYDAESEIVTKPEALALINDWLDKQGVAIDVDVLMELFSWQNKLLLWLMQEKAAASKRRTL
jgi:hypothetical protein